MHLPNKKKSFPDLMRVQEMLKVVNYDNLIPIFPNFVGKHFEK